jgi:DNA-binding NarL/FixJ family response regulator
VTTISVLLVDDHTVVRSGLKALLGTQADIAVVGEAASGEEALEAAQEHNRRWSSWTLAMGAGMDGIEAIKLLRQRNPQAGNDRVHHL